jgi:hypothetical protein
MATTTFGVNTNDSANAATYVSTAFTPAAGDLLVVFVSASGTTAIGSMTDSQGGSSWVTAIIRRLYNTNASSLYCFVRTSSVAASSMTVTFDCTGDNATGANQHVIRIAGMSKFGSAAVLQTASEENQASGTTPAPVFGASALTGNVTLGAIGAQGAAPLCTPPTNWTELQDTSYTVPNNGLETVNRDSGFTGTTITWGSTVGAAWASLTVELDTTGGAVPYSSPYPQLLAH